MEGRLFYFLLALQIVTWASAISRPFKNGLGVHQQAAEQISKSVQVSYGGSKESSKAATINEKEMYFKGVSRIGSSPPSCDHKCYGCTPCEAIQVPTNSKRNHVGLQYTNYEPEGWKCKCGPSFYSP